MQTIDVDLSIAGASSAGVRPTRAHRQALLHWQANIEALGRIQPDLPAQLGTARPQHKWVYARDGSLTALRSAESWLGGCSVPARAAAQIIQKVDSRGTQCLIAPPLPHLIQRVLELMEPTHALIVILPDLEDLGSALHCIDFVDAIRGNRLWFATGLDWPRELGRILESHPGLPLPQQFTRALIDEGLAAPLIADAQRTFTSESNRRSTVLANLRASAPPKGNVLTCLSPSRFRLWDNAGQILHDALALGDLPVRRVDPDDPCSSGNLSLAMAAAESRAVITANSTRAELGALVPSRTPIITWMTSAAIPRFEPGDARDMLLLADPAWHDRAIARGWPVDRLRVAGWPSLFLERIRTQGEPTLALIADTHDISTPSRPLPLSSHRLLWELIRDELLANPFALASDRGSYLNGRMERLHVGPDGFDAPFFVERLIIPAYQQGIARLLLGNGLPLKIHGGGWQNIAEYSALSAGPITSRDELRDAASAATALIHAWPAPYAHPIDSCGVPIVRSFNQSSSSFIQAARTVLSGSCQFAPHTSPLSGELIISCLESPRQ